MMMSDLSPCYHIYDLRGAVRTYARLRGRHYYVAYDDGLCGQGFYMQCATHQHVTMFLGSDLEEAINQVYSLCKQYRASITATLKDGLGYE